MSENSILDQNNNQNEATRESSYSNLILFAVFGTVGIVALFLYNPDNLAVIALVAVAFYIMLIGVFKLKRMTEE